MEDVLQCISFLFQNHCETFWKTLIQNVYRIETATWTRESFVSSLFDVHELSFGDRRLFETLDIVVEERKTVLLLRRLLSMVYLSVSVFDTR